ncbi:hypothetical protein [Pseudoalteromonas sp.]|uniref:hypothetical protein n=1 Tax=Pseudoalteromonas sp. TaxID=53249 RepID=UPI00356A449E
MSINIFYTDEPFNICQRVKSNFKSLNSFEDKLIITNLPNESADANEEVLFIQHDKIFSDYLLKVDVKSLLNEINSGCGFLCVNLFFLNNEQLIEFLDNLLPHCTFEQLRNVNFTLVINSRYKKIPYEILLERLFISSCIEKQSFLFEYLIIRTTRLPLFRWCLSALTKIKRLNMWIKNVA